MPDSIRHPFSPSPWAEHFPPRRRAAAGFRLKAGMTRMCGTRRPVGTACPASRSSTSLPEESVPPSLLRKH